MVTFLQNPLMVGPSLSAALQKIRRSPLPRLLIGYRLLPVRRNLGRELYLQRLIAGGNQNEALPISVQRAKLNSDSLLGQGIDLTA